MNSIDMNNKVKSMIGSWFESGGKINQGTIDKYAVLLLRKHRKDKVSFIYIYNLREIILPYYPLFPLFFMEYFKGDL